MLRPRYFQSQTALAFSVHTIWPVHGDQTTQCTPQSTDQEHQREKAHLTDQAHAVPSIDHLLVVGNTPPADYNHIKSLLNTGAVAKAIENQSPDRILNRIPSPVAAEEKTLPRSYRCTSPNSVRGIVKP